MPRQPRAIPPPRLASPRAGERSSARECRLALHQPLSFEDDRELSPKSRPQTLWRCAFALGIGSDEYQR